MKELDGLIEKVLYCIRIVPNGDDAILTYIELYYPEQYKKFEEQHLDNRQGSTVRATNDII
jgi:hypothetical protein